ncbi:hypothetical protein D3C84_605760 [compost metagenome]
MVSRRTAEGEGGIGALAHMVLGGQRYLGGAVHGLPGAGGDGRLGIEAVVAELAMQRGGDGPVAAQAARREGRGQQVAAVALGGPAVPGALEELQVGPVVHPQDRLEAEVAGLDHFAQVLLANPRQHGVRAAGHFETGLELAIDQFRLAEVETVIVAVDGQHGGHLIRVLLLMGGFCAERGWVAQW